MNLTDNQKKIQLTLFKDVETNSFFTVNVYKGIKTNSGKFAYPIIDSFMPNNNIYFHECFLLSAIKYGECKKGIMYIKKVS